ncbi:MAG: hypothetical protein U0802_13975 [Candidatus Binatia bacterium]
MIASYAALTVAAGALSIAITPAVFEARRYRSRPRRPRRRAARARGRVPRLGGIALLIAGSGALVLGQALRASRSSTCSNRTAGS